MVGEGSVEGYIAIGIREDLQGIDSPLKACPDLAIQDRTICKHIHIQFTQLLLL